MKDDPQSWRRRTWRGMNQLGRILTETRDALMKEVSFANLVNKPFFFVSVFISS